MNENQMSEASRYLLALAERNAQAYASLPNTRAIIVTGSAAEGLSDFYSDLDMIVYYDTLPSEEELLAACQQNQGEDRNLFVERSDDGCAELYVLHGVQCQIGHTTINSW